MTTQIKLDRQIQSTNLSSKNDTLVDSVRILSDITSVEILKSHIISRIFKIPKLTTVIVMVGL